MHKPASQALRHTLAVAAVAAMLAACSDDAPLAPDRPATLPARFATHANVETEVAVATLQRVTARYHDINAAIDDDFVLLHGCESRPGEGPVGTVYVHMGRLLDGVIDPQLPDALIYEPGNTGRLTLVGVEFAVPYSLWTQPEPPAFFGNTFQREDEFGVYALHAWVWRKNPAGLFAETNPRVSCGEA